MEVHLEKLFLLNNLWKASQKLYISAKPFSHPVDIHCKCIAELFLQMRDHIFFFPVIIDSLLQTLMIELKSYL